MEQLVAQTAGVSLHQAENVIKLLEGGATVPFISRYRKEMTGNLDEVKIQYIKDEHTRLSELSERKATILKTIDEQGKLTDELRRQIEESWNAAEIEDLYLPYKPKRKTRAAKARENGLEPLANVIMLQQNRDMELEAEKYLSDAVPTVEEALQGARDIIAEKVSEDKQSRDIVREAFTRHANITTKKAKGFDGDAEKYRDYLDRSESLGRCPSHRLLAMMRAEKEGVVSLHVAPDEPERAVERIGRKYLRSNNGSANHLRQAISDSYSRLIEPSIETEFINQSKEKADTEAIRVFTENLRQLLLAAPLGQKRIMAIDPGIRTGCKTVCLDAQGQLLCHDVIFPMQRRQEAEQTVRHLAEKHRIEAIAIGNGTASRETEQFVRQLGLKCQFFVVSEDGASVYSASKTARDEFPNEDVTVRGAVSIGRRLMDPLAELVKIDPKSIGVGQYQHDVDQTRLREALEATVESCVNMVGVNVNTASMHLLTYVSGLGPTLAQNIVDYRTQNGPFSSRAELKKVPRLGQKAFEQCAGFLRLEGKNPLDNSAVHPESYHIVEQMAKDAKLTVSQLIADKQKQKTIDIKRYVSATVGLPTLQDIMSELEKPGRDPREQIEEFHFAEGISQIEHLVVGMELPGIVTNLTAFGAFVDIGVHQDGLVHISQCSDKFVKDINDVLKLHQHVVVKVVEVDIVRRRIGLSMKGISQH
ncbi:MAG: RNA-binding transcriptional accessory protein [Bacteroidales bacterium]|nr:RNA-binding transcriptional accessory protein [Bacteroidales bacterium]